MFANTQLFREEAVRFKKFGYYTDAPQGSVPYREYWEEQKKRCLEGYSVAGTYITGYHYYYLNFYQIEVVETDYTVSKERAKADTIITFPDFWDGDYHYFHAIEDAVAAGSHMVVLKARGKGFSYKGGAMLGRNFHLIPRSKGYAIASEKEFLIKDGLLTKTAAGIEFAFEHTAFGKFRGVKNEDMHRRASYRTPQGAEKGYMSEIIGVTLKNDPQRARGKRGKLVFWEEGGKFPHLLTAWQIARRSVERGAFTTGLMLAFGTGGEEGADFEAMEEMFQNPEAYNVYPFDNEWDDPMIGEKCGYFFPIEQNLEGFIDKDGNSLKEEALAHEKKERAKVKENAKDPKAIDRYLAENPTKPSEALLDTGQNNFPTELLKAQKARVMSSKDLRNIGVPGRIIEEPEKGIRFVADLSIKPLRSRRPGPDEDPSGGIVMYYPPYRVDGKVPPGLYVVVHDPYDQDKSEYSPSLGAAFVMKRPNNFSRPDDMIVASYVGRPESLDDYNENLFNLAKLYNAKIGFENDRGDVAGYAKREKLLHYLEEQFEMPYDPKLASNKVKRGWGMHMTTERKLTAELYLRDWLKQKRYRDDSGAWVRNLHYIYDIPLLDELIKFRRDKNFDRVSAMFIGMYHLKELYHKEITEPQQEQEESFFDREFFS